jgi:hypothetical protein
MNRIMKPLKRRRRRPRLSAPRNMAAKKSGASGERADFECRTLREVRRPGSGLRDLEPMSKAKRASRSGSVGLIDGAN